MVPGLKAVLSAIERFLTNSAEFKQVGTVLVAADAEGELAVEGVGRGGKVGRGVGVGGAGEDSTRKLRFRMRTTTGVGVPGEGAERVVPGGVVATWAQPARTHNRSDTTPINNFR